MPLEILVVGAGAIGALYASRLATVPSVNVSCVLRSNYPAVKKANGFKVSSPSFGQYHFTPTRIFANPQEARKANVHWNFIVVATKALPDVSDDSEILQGLVRDGTAIVLIQNGLGVEEPYVQRFPKAVILSAVTILSAAQPEPGHIKHNRWTRISIGPFLQSTTPKVQETIAMDLNKKFVNLLQGGGIKDADAYDHTRLQQVRWHKIAINASMNPSSVLAGGWPNADMAKDPELSRHLKGVMDEVLDTAEKVLGQKFPEKGFAKPEKILESTRKNDSGSKPSMALDWEQGKKMEIEVILGNPIRIARRKGYEMPRTQAMYALLKAAQDSRDAKQKKQGGKL